MEAVSKVLFGLVVEVSGEVDDRVQRIHLLVRDRGRHSFLVVRLQLHILVTDHVVDVLEHYQVGLIEIKLDLLHNYFQMNNLHHLG